MKSELRNKFFDDLLSAVIMIAVMYPITTLFQYQEQWEFSSYWVAVVLILIAGIWLLSRATQEKRFEIVWTVTECEVFRFGHIFQPWQHTHEQIKIAICELPPKKM